MSKMLFLQKCLLAPGQCFSSTLTWHGVYFHKQLFVSFSHSSIFFLICTVPLSRFCICHLSTSLPLLCYIFFFLAPFLLLPCLSSRFLSLPLPYLYLLDSCLTPSLACYPFLIPYISSSSLFPCVSFHQPTWSHFSPSNTCSLSLYFSL